MKIYKYPVLWGTTVLDKLVLPSGSKVLSFAVQRESIVCYAAVPESDDGSRWNIRLAIVGTGHPVDAGVITHWDFFGTHVLHGGDLMFHVFVDRIIDRKLSVAGNGSETT